MFAMTEQRSVRHLCSVPWLATDTAIGIPEHGWL
jgi:hypothetical protein